MSQAPDITAITAADIDWTLTSIDVPCASPDGLLVEALLEAQSYRVLAQQALHCLHAVQLERDVLRGQRSLDRQREREKAAP